MWLGKSFDIHFKEVEPPDLSDEVVLDSGKSNITPLRLEKRLFINYITEYKIHVHLTK